MSSTSLLQVVMSPHHPPQAFVDNCAKLLPDTDPGDFQKLLEMKVRRCVINSSCSRKKPSLYTDVSFQGLKRQEQTSLIELHRARHPQLQTHAANSASAQRPSTRASPATSASGGLSFPSFSFDQESSRIKKLEKLIKKRL